MKTVIHFIRPLILILPALAAPLISSRAQEVSIPDPGLNAAILAALQKPSGPLTEQDLLSLTNLNASQPIHQFHPSGRVHRAGLPRR